MQQKRVILKGKFILRPQNQLIEEAQRQIKEKRSKKDKRKIKAAVQTEMKDEDTSEESNIEEPEIFVVELAYGWSAPSDTR